MYYFRAALPSPRKTLQNYKLVLNYASFSTVFFADIPPAASPAPSGTAGEPPFPKASAKVGTFLLPSKFFSKKVF
jgi:hypothetical protein